MFNYVLDHCPYTCRWETFRAATWQPRSPRTPSQNIWTLRRFWKAWGSILQNSEDMGFSKQPCVGADRTSPIHVGLQAFQSKNSLVTNQRRLVNLLKVSLCMAVVMDKHASADWPDDAITYQVVMWHHRKLNCLTFSWVNLSICQIKLQVMLRYQLAVEKSYFRGQHLSWRSLWQIRM